ncbi:MAG: hypothetical protein JWM12_1662 [Ilumatobacteraceae bacterium]|nr:hypothetical protein [Ilumatobacteraceae bacterium]
MKIKRSLQFLAPVLLVAALGACGSDTKSGSTTASTAVASTTVATAAGSTATGDTATGGTTGSGAMSPFCQFEQDINSGIADGSETPASLVDALKTFEPRMDQWIADAPAEMKANAETLVAAARKTIASGDETDLSGDPNVATAGSAVDAFCGLS